MNKVEYDAAEVDHFKALIEEEAAVREKSVLRKKVRDRTTGYDEDIRHGFSKAELAMQRWREAQRQRSPSRSRKRRRRRERSRSRSPSSFDGRGPPLDPRRLDHCNRQKKFTRHEKEDSAHWHHDRYHESLQAAKVPDRDPNYLPPEPEWFSRAGGIYIKNPHAWINSPRR